LKWAHSKVVHLVELLHQYFNIPIAVTNDANAAAIGEMIYGGAKEVKDFVLITLGTGLGSGVVVNGELVYGHDGFAGEIGDILVDIHNYENDYHEDEGCLETMAGVGVLYSKLYALMKRGRAGILKKLVNGEGEGSVSLGLIEKAVTVQDLHVTDVFDDTMKKWAIAIINLNAMLDPDLLILGGVVNEGNKVVLSRIRHYISKILFHDVNICLGTTNEYQMYGGMYMLKVHVLNMMLPEKLFD
jgi:glucokinase